MSGIDIADMVYREWEQTVLPVIRRLENGETIGHADVHDSGDRRCVLSVVSSGSVSGEEV